ncbi:nucleotidyltransferase domain-containing protein [Spirosoma taeanense]|uniref:Nucleotidyltransferase domain-containing protein n=1 Tax=Spirosoma taeanense TaxID=2735870 RepID=A0A6M5Y9F6_9BACT|nr:nucleotidyltransferase domain-containing protein [Spirosoma taeanense]QJW90897.1 nucleotidyltransferase domain-containing protein [Spirosoma taeanense]
MDARPRKVADDVKQAMQSLYGHRLDRVVLFGSHARGDYRADSDIDFLVVLNDERISRLEEINRFLSAQSEISLKHDITLSILPVSRKKYIESAMPVYYFARMEGITL